MLFLKGGNKRKLHLFRGKSNVHRFSSIAQNSVFFHFFEVLFDFLPHFLAVFALVPVSSLNQSSPWGSPSGDSYCDGEALFALFLFKHINVVNFYKLKLLY